MSAGEIIDILNEHGDIVDTISREEAERDNHITENVLVFVFNSLGRVWVQLRPMSKKHYPGRWDISACGGVVSGETHQQAAERETAEEMGILVVLHYIDSFINVFPGDNGEVRRRLSHLYVGQSDELPVVSEEVDDFKIWQPSQLKEDVVYNPDRYIPSFAIELDKAQIGYQNLRESNII